MVNNVSLVRDGDRLHQRLRAEDAQKTRTGRDRYDKRLSQLQILKRLRNMVQVHTYNLGVLSVQTANMNGKLGS